MSNHDAAEAIKNMSETEQAEVKKAYLGLIFKCMAGLALIGVIAVFFVMQGVEEERFRYINEGVVSKALVLDKAVDSYTLKNAKGKTAESSKNFVHIVHDPKSTVTYSELGKSVKEADLPVPKKDESTGVMDMDDTEFVMVQVGQVLTVVNTPYEPQNPWTLAKLRDYSPASYYLWMAIFGVLAVTFWFTGRRFSLK
ncbi:MAG: hypothetical protein ABJ360_14920 [Roseobacter sp.]|uniref:hypothetical protein n=1 Tax=Parasphingorhabdus sp. TaxID=2709688 RepID=UPI003266B365